MGITEVVKLTVVGAVATFVVFLTMEAALPYLVYMAKIALFLFMFYCMGVLLSMFWDWYHEEE